MFKFKYENLFRFFKQKKLGITHLYRLVVYE
jgi:hypothetical protein